MSGALAGPCSWAVDSSSRLTHLVSSGDQHFSHMPGLLLRGKLSFRSRSRSIPLASLPAPTVAIALHNARPSSASLCRWRTCCSSFYCSGPWRLLFLSCSSDFCVRPAPSLPFTFHPPPTSGHRLPLDSLPPARPPFSSGITSPGSLPLPTSGWGFCPCLGSAGPPPGPRQCEPGTSTAAHECGATEPESSLSRHGRASSPLREGGPKVTSLPHIRVTETEAWGKHKCIQC